MPLPRIFSRTLAHASTAVTPRVTIPHITQDFSSPEPPWLSLLSEMTAVKARRTTRHTLPCILMRAGTSKGIFLHRHDLPSQVSDWSPHLISALGSRNNDPRQIDGVGGGTSTTSKVAVVSPSDRPDADVEFIFVQVAVGKEAVDLTGTCGNISSGVGPFAVQEGIVRPLPGQTKVRACFSQLDAFDRITNMG